jgi:hypothetical protein
VNSHRSLPFLYILSKLYILSDLCFCLTHQKIHIDLKITLVLKKIVHNYILLFIHFYLIFYNSFTVPFTVPFTGTFMVPFTGTFTGTFSTTLLEEFSKLNAYFIVTFIAEPLKLTFFSYYTNLLASTKWSPLYFNFS